MKKPIIQVLLFIMGIVLAIFAIYCAIKADACGTSIYYADDKQFFMTTFGITLPCGIINVIIAVALQFSKEEKVISYNREYNVQNYDEIENNVDNNIVGEAKNIAIDVEPDYYIDDPALLEDNEDISYKERQEREHVKLYYGAIVINNFVIETNEETIELKDAKNYGVYRNEFVFSYNNKEYSIECMNSNEANDINEYVKGIKAKMVVEKMNNQL